jgi:hypothetical protein
MIMSFSAFEITPFKGDHWPNALEFQLPTRSQTDVSGGTAGEVRVGSAASKGISKD